MAIETANISDGQLVLNSDLDGYGNAAELFPGALAEMISGITSVNSNINPLTVAPVSGNTIACGGSGQWCVAQGNIADYLPSTNQTLAASASLDRYDLLCFQFANFNGDPYSTSFMDFFGNITNNVTVYHTFRSVIYTIVQGAPGAGQTATPPAGYDRVAWIKVRGNSSSIVAGDITMILPTWAQVIAGYSPSVTQTTVNGASGNVVLSSPTNTITVSGSGTAIHLDVTNPGVSVIESTDGTIGVSAVPNGFNLSAIPSGVTIVASSVYSRVRRNATQPGAGNLISPSAVSLSPIGTPLGSFLVSSGASLAFQIEYKVHVKAGAGAQSVSGACDQIGGYIGAFLDGTPVSQQSSPSGGFTWSITVPDDGNYHNLILQVQNGSTIQCFWTSWIPQLNGSVDYTKFSYIGPTNSNYSLP